MISARLGLGYANLGALLMARGVPTTARKAARSRRRSRPLMTGTAYRASAEISSHTGPFRGFAPNREPLPSGSSHPTGVTSPRSTPSYVPELMLQKTRKVWDEVLELGREVGIPERAGHRPRADRNDRLHDGLRHDRRRTGHRAHQVQAAASGAGSSRS